jgi:hypothetical protein
MLCCPRSLAAGPDPADCRQPGRPASARAPTSPRPRSCHVLIPGARLGCENLLMAPSITRHHFLGADAVSDSDEACRVHRLVVRPISMCPALLWAPGPPGPPRHPRDRSLRYFAAVHRSTVPLRCSKLSSDLGGAMGTRTPDLLHAMQALYQLSYSPSERPAHRAAAPRQCTRNLRTAVPAHTGR